MCRCGWILAVLFLVIPPFCHGMAAAADPPRDSTPAHELLTYIGTYTNGASKGIYLTRFDLDNGTFRPVTLAAKVANPSFLAIHPSRMLLYAISELDEPAGTNSGTLSAFAIDPTHGKLTLLNRQLSGNKIGCHVIVDQSGKCVLVASYGGGTITCLPIEPDGRLGEASSRCNTAGRASFPAARPARTHTAWRWIPPTGSPSSPISGWTRSWCTVSKPAEN